jgi:NADH-quinone oxidoreductase subunit K
MALFSLGAYGYISQKSGIKVLMSIELMLNAAAINFAAFSNVFGAQDGYVFVLFVIAIAAAEAAVGLAIYVNLFRSRKTITISRVDSLRW